MAFLQHQLADCLPLLHGGVNSSGVVGTAQEVDEEGVVKI